MLVRRPCRGGSRSFAGRRGRLLRNRRFRLDRLPRRTLAPGQTYRQNRRAHQHGDPHSHRSMVRRPLAAGQRLPPGRGWLPSTATGPQKQNGRPALADRPNLIPNRVLQRLDVRSLQTLRATYDFELNGLAVVQGLISFRLDRGKMHEDIFPRLALDEAKALAGVKPLHGSLFFTHFLFLFSSLKLSGALLRIPSRGLLSSAAFCGSAQRAQKKAASLTLRPLHNTKAIQEQQTQL